MNRTIKSALLAITLTLGCRGALFIEPAQAKGIVTDRETAISVLIAAGYKPIEVGGFSWFSGCHGSWYQTKFTAISPSGALVAGTICNDIISKGAQILINTR